ncbi:hypothetical protein [Parvularcula marina]|uniref:hypothetical protein n=1 Tax=Parvularcula marina TaxID=2292771 RepID=UPI003518CF56
MKKSLLTAACTMGLGLVPALAQSDLAPPRCDYGAPNENAPEELSQFAFLIGDYTISAHAWQNGAWSPPRPGTPARWNGYYGLEGMAIVDEWYGRDPGIEPETGRGINVRMWDAEDGEWDMMWIATAGRQVQDLRAKVMDGVLTMWQVYPERPEFKATFHIEDEDHWARISYVPDENGEWQPQFKLAATRIPCGEE